MSSAKLPGAKASILILVVAIFSSAASRKEQHSKHRSELESIYLTGRPDMAAPIVVVLHGDAPFVNRAYQYAFASNLADAAPGTRVFTMFRPAAVDPSETKLGVERAIAFGDHYTLEVVDDIARTIESLKAHWKAPGVVLVGDDGGAALAAYIAALQAGLVQSAVLIHCPCDVPALRLNNKHVRQNSMSFLTVHKISPVEALDQMSKGIKITVIAGMNDSGGAYEIARSYVARATALGISASMTMVPSRGRKILDDLAVIKGTAKVIRNQ